MSNVALTKAAYPLIIGGKEFAAYTYTDKDFEEIDQYIQSKIIAVARTSLSAVDITSERAELLQAAIKAAASSGWGTSEGNKIVSTIEGTFRLGWQMIKSKNKISFEEFCKIARGNSQEVTSDSMEAIQIAFMQLNTSGTSDEEESEASSENTKSE